MAVETLISVDEYLRTSYDPDCDYVEGLVTERNVGEIEHSRLQYRIAVYFGARESEFGLVGYTEQRVQVSQRRFRIPDLCFVAAGCEEERIITRPPLLCIEILSSGDRVLEVEERVEDYLTMGVPVVWVISPKLRKGWEYTAAERREAKDGILRAPGGISMELAQVLKPT